MSNNRVSATLSPADQKAVLDAIATIKQKLPFLVDLTPDERHGLPRLGDKSRAFVSKAAQVAAQNPDFLPRSFDVDEMRRDADLFEALQPIDLALTQLQELLDDTLVEVGGEAYAAALAVYSYAKNSGQGQALDSVADELSRRFAHKSSSAASKSKAA
ncbi:MAG: hypothetical protein WA821_01055 [Anaerolineales bacterium]